MYHRITAVILILGLCPFTNGLFFGLFSSRPQQKPDVIVNETATTTTTELVSDRDAYEKYILALSNRYREYPPVQYVPVYTIQPQYIEYTQPQPNYIYRPTVKVQSQPPPVPVQFEYNQLPYSASVQFQRPITVLPSGSYHETSLKVPDVTVNRIKSTETPTSTNSVISMPKTLENEIPEPQMSTSLYDLPVSGIAPDFRTGGYVTKNIASDVSSWESKSRSGRKFGHAYSSGDGTKVLEEGRLVQLSNGQETVIKRGQYEYVDATGETVLVKWIADDNGFRLIN